MAVLCQLVCNMKSDIIYSTNSCFNQSLFSYIVFSRRIDIEKYCLDKMIRKLKIQIKEDVNVCTTMHCVCHVTSPLTSDFCLRCLQVPIEISVHCKAYKCVN